MRRIMSTKELVLCVTLGAAALTVRSLNLVAVVLPPFKLDPRWIFSLLAASWTGPFGGFISGLLAGLPSEHHLDIFPASVTHFIIGFICRNLKLGWKGILLWPVFGVPAWILTFYIFFPATIIKGGWIVVAAVTFIGVVSSISTTVIAALIQKRYGPLLKQYGLVD